MTPKICRICNQTCKKVEKALECDLCNHWYHAKCQEVNDKMYDVITQDSDSKDGATLQWHCKPSCNNVAAKFSSVLKNIQDQMNMMKEELTATKHTRENRG